MNQDNKLNPQVVSAIFTQLGIAIVQAGTQLLVERISEPLDRDIQRMIKQWKLDERVSVLLTKAKEHRLKPFRDV